MYLKRKVFNSWFDRRIEMGGILEMERSRQDLAQVVLFGLGVVVTLRMMPCPISFLIQKALYKVSQMRYCLLLNSFQKVIKKSKRFENLGEPKLIWPSVPTGFVKLNLSFFSKSNVPPFCPDKIIFVLNKIFFVLG